MSRVLLVEEVSTWACDRCGRDATGNRPPEWLKEYSVMHRGMSYWRDLCDDCLPLSTLTEFMPSYGHSVKA